MNDFKTKQLFSRWLMMAIPCSGGAIICLAIAIGLAINRNWLWLAFEGFVTYCFASSAIYYWHKYFVQRERNKLAKGKNYE